MWLSHPAVSAALSLLSSSDLFLYFLLLLLQVLQSRLRAVDPGIVGQLGYQRRCYNIATHLSVFTFNVLSLGIWKTLNVFFLFVISFCVFSGSHLESRFLLWWWWFLYFLLRNVLLFLLAVTLKQVVATVVFHCMKQSKTASLCILLRF